MSERIHDDEPDTSEAVARALMRAAYPRLARSPIEYLATSGTDNAMWRVRTDRGADVVARLPRRPGAAAGVLQEVSVLQQLGGALANTGVATPSVVHVGQPHDVFPHHWSILKWIDGTDAWSARDRLTERDLDALAGALARSVTAIGQLGTDVVERRRPASRGGPLGPLVERLHRWLDDPVWNARGLVEVDRIRRLTAEAIEIADEPIDQGFVHGDLIPGNLLIDRDRLGAIIDWGGAGMGDTAQDLAPAWAVLPPSARLRFREALAVDDAAWIRGRTFELEHAVGGVLYYVPRGHPLGDVMARTLNRILDHP